MMIIQNQSRMGSQQTVILEFFADFSQKRPMFLLKTFQWKSDISNGKIILRWKICFFMEKFNFPMQNRFLHWKFCFCIGKVWLFEESFIFFWKNDFLLENQFFHWRNSFFIGTFGFQWTNTFSNGKYIFHRDIGFFIGKPVKSSKTTVCWDPSLLWFWMMMVDDDNDENLDDADKMI